MGTENRCQSCSMPIEAGALCVHCADEDGELRPFDELFERFVQWTRRQEADLSREEAERTTLDFMARMPAWRDHPEVAARRQGGGA